MPLPAPCGRPGPCARSLNAPAGRLGSRGASLAPGSGTEFALPRGVLLVRCAWHSRYHGYPRLLGVASWRGLRVQFSDGICPTCATRVMFDYARAVPPPEASRWPDTRRAAALFVGVPLTAALVLAAAPLSEPPPPPAVSALPADVAGPAPDVTRVAAAEPRGPRGATRRDCDAIARRAVALASSRTAGAAPVVGLAPRLLTVGPPRHPPPRR